MKLNQHNFYSSTTDHTVNQRKSAFGSTSSPLGDHFPKQHSTPNYSIKRSSTANTLQFVQFHVETEVMISFVKVPKLHISHRSMFS